MDEDKIRRALQESGIENQITCAQAWKIAEEYGIPKADIGEFCNRYRVKIRGCQLGCFK
ncbi:MAG: hypothetical protein QMD46_06315 [Methanomicrobiales archaeon]|nr:hypothetical protein [Methanomicrobiales archaeon]MDI6876120.1 hypothetical protein [Methanomicrobiales archaeon]